MAGHAAAFTVPGHEGAAHRRLSSASVNGQNWAGAHRRAAARSFRQPERVAVLGIVASAGDRQPRPRGPAAPRLQKARAAITDSLSLLRSGEEQEDLVGVYDEMLVDKSGRMAKVSGRPNRMAAVLTRHAWFGTIHVCTQPLRIVSACQDARPCISD